MQVRTFNGRRLYQARLRASLSQDDLAFALRSRTSAKTGARSVRRWENGEATPHSTLIPAIANVLDVTVDSLFEHDESDDDGDRALLAELDRLPASAMPAHLRMRIRAAVARTLVEPVTGAGAGSTSVRGREVGS